jgi:hypothetical protein
MLSLTEGLAMSYSDNTGYIHSLVFARIVSNGVTWESRWYEVASQQDLDNYFQEAFRTNYRNFIESSDYFKYLEDTLEVRILDKDTEYFRNHVVGAKIRAIRNILEKMPFTTEQRVLGDDAFAALLLFSFPARLVKLLSVEQCKRAFKLLLVTPKLTWNTIMTLVNEDVDDTLVRAMMASEGMERV